MKRLRVERVAKAIGGFTLEADFEVGAGSRAVLTGSSGGGKTTLLRLIAGLERPDSGRIWIGDEDVTALAPRERRLGYVFQDHALFPSMSVLENAAFGLRMRGAPRAERVRLAEQWLERVGLGPKRDQPITMLSGGERSRVAFVRALIAEPRVLLLDEPFAALDPELRAGLRAEVLALLSRCPAPLILVTHDPEDAQILATHRLLLTQAEGGRLRQIRMSAGFSGGGMGK